MRTQQHPPPLCRSSLGKIAGISADARAGAASDTSHMMMRRSAIFDLDGTLTDSKPGILGCLVKTLQAHGIAWTGPLDWFIGPPADDSMRRLMPDADELQRATFLHDYRLCYDATGWAENSVYPGVHALLQGLQGAGWQLFVCTSKREDFAVRILEKFSLNAYFLALYADTAGSLHHTKTALLRRLLEEQSLDPAFTFMIGDRNFDIEAARANGVRSIAVTYGYGTPEELESARPDYTCHTVEDLLLILSAPFPIPSGLR
jgi:phosphoglycolate phosphatase